jgi:hypothetical protein
MWRKNSHTSGCSTLSVPPHALPLLIPDRLACHEITRQTVIGGISKELKGYSKKVWPPFPIHLNTYSLLDFEHAKSEAVALEDINLVHIEFKKHDPHRVVSNHLASCGLKRFEHENSPHDDIFHEAQNLMTRFWLEYKPCHPREGRCCQIPRAQAELPSSSITG